VFRVVETTPRDPRPNLTWTFRTENDVLCGRGGESNYHKGNVQFRNLIKQHQPLYVQSVSSKEKSAIFQSIAKKSTK